MFIINTKNINMNKKWSFERLRKIEIVYNSGKTVNMNKMRTPIIFCGFDFVLLTGLTF